jgi:DNA-binding SARP family transcriptional activator
MLDVLLLGPAEVREAGRAVRLTGPRQRVVLARLAVAEGRPVSQEALVRDLWDVTPPADPPHALQAQISRLRRTLPVAIELVAGGYRWDPEAVETDVSRFAQLCRTGREQLASGDAAAASASFRAALGLWRGPAFADVPETAALRHHAVRLEETRQRAVGDRIDADLRSGAAGDLVSELRGIVEQYPLRERHWGQLMLALHHDGRTAEAIDAFRHAREVFAEELGTDPGEALDRLHQEMLRGSTGADLPTPAPDDRPAPDSAGVRLPAELALHAHAPLVGRERELAVLERRWTESSGALRMVTITGEPGIGKTRLAADFATRCGREGARVLFGRNDQYVSVLCQPFAEMLRADLADGDTEPLTRELGPYPADLARLVPELADRLPASVAPALRSDPGTEQQRFFDAVAGWLATASAGGPVLLVIDDLQWADRQTLLLLRHLSRSARPVRALVLATYRDRDRVADEANKDLLAALLRQSGAQTHLPLSGLDDSAVARLLADELEITAPGADVPAGLEERVASAAGGNPLFVVELARQLGDVVPEGGLAVPALPAGVQDVVDRRLADLPEQVRTMLQHAAIIGREFDPRVLQRTTALDDADIDGLLEAATHARLTEPIGGPRLRYTFSHDVVRAALYDATPPLRRSALHRTVAEAIEQVHADDLPGHSRELGHHYSAAAVGSAESVRPAVHYLMLAGTEALAHGAPPTAVRHYREAVGLLPASAGPDERCDLLIGLGTSEFHAGEPAYRATLLEAARLAVGAGDAPRLTAAAVANNRGWWSSTADVDQERVAVIEAALATCDVSDRASYAELLMSWALENVRDPSQRERAVARSADALGLAEGLGDEHLLARLLSHRYAVVYASFSDPGGCVDLSRRLSQLANQRADPGLQLNAAIGVAQSSMMVGDFATADRALERSAQLGEVLDQPARLWLTRCWQAMCTAMRGDLLRGEELAVAACELGTDTEQPDATTWFAGQLFTLRMLQGRLPELLDEIEAQVISQSGGIPAWRAAYALALTTVDRCDEAATILDEFVGRDFAQLPLDMLWLHGMTYLCGVSEAVDDPDAARALHDALLPYAGLMAHNGTLDAGPVDLHLGRMARVHGDSAVAQQHLARAVDLCQRIDAPLWSARAREG